MSLTRRQFVIGAGTLAYAAAIAGEYRWLRRRRPKLAKPNMILFLADDMRYDAAGYLGSAIVKTPNLDALARRSVIFDNNFVTTSVCSISRASILTGTYLHRHHVQYGHDMLPAYLFADSYPELLRRNGYYTGFIGKWGIGGQPAKAFDRWYGFGGQGVYYPDKKNPRHLTDIQTAQALDFLRHAPVDKPFLLIVAYKAPHDPFVPQPQFAKLYEDTAIPRAPTDTFDGFKRLPNLLKRSRGRNDYMGNHYIDPKAFQSSVKNYYRLVTGLDDSVGQILSAMDDLGLTDSTCAAFTSDNGFMLGEHGLMGKWCMYEESIRTPLLIAPARDFFPARPSSRRAGMALNIDLAPTFLAMAGIVAPKFMQGKSLLPLIASADAPWRDGFYYEHPLIKSGAMIGAEGYRNKEWKYTHYYWDKAGDECLFNVASDPQEMNNLAVDAQYKPTLESLRALTAQARNALK